MGARVDRVIVRSRAVDSDVALFGHGNVLRVLVARWIGLPAGGGRHFLLGTDTLCVPRYPRRKDLESVSHQKAMSQRINLRGLRNEQIKERAL